MQIAGHEFVAKEIVPMRQTRKAIEAIDAMRAAYLSFVETGDEATAVEYERLWREFVSIAFEEPEKIPAAESFDFWQVKEAAGFFSKARAKTSV